MIWPCLRNSQRVFKRHLVFKRHFGNKPPTTCLWMGAMRWMCEPTATGIVEVGRVAGAWVCLSFDASRLADLAS